MKNLLFFYFSVEEIILVNIFAIYLLFFFLIFNFFPFYFSFFHTNNKNQKKYLFNFFVSYIFQQIYPILSDTRRDTKKK